MQASVCVFECPSPATGFAIEMPTDCHKPPVCVCVCAAVPVSGPWAGDEIDNTNIIKQNRVCVFDDIRPKTTWR